MNGRGIFIEKDFLFLQAGKWVQENQVDTNPSLLSIQKKLPLQVVLVEISDKPTF